MKVKQRTGGSLATRFKAWWLLALVAGVSVFLLIGCQQASLLLSSPERSLSKASASSAVVKGIDELGYNYTARLFVGAADGVDRILDGMVWGDPTYAYDHLVMKWSKAWDDARFHGAPWTPDAWVDNEWNGMVDGGSGEVWHDKIVWVGPELQDSPYWRDGGLPIWGEFEIILSQGVVDGVHSWETHAVPTGYGPY
jgi:hypothetical protein